MTHQPEESEGYQERMEGPSLWGRILGLIEQDLDERRSRRHFVEVCGEAGLYEKEIGELSPEERWGLDPVLREQVMELLLDRHLAQQGHVDLVGKRRAVRTEKVEDLTPEDLPALVEADRLRAEEEHQRGHEQAEFVREAQADLDRLPVAALADPR